MTEGDIDFALDAAEQAFQTLRKRAHDLPPPVEKLAFLTAR